MLMSEPIRASYGVLNEKCSPKAHGLNVWSPLDDAVWGAYGTSRGWSHTKENISLGADFEGL